MPVHRYLSHSSFVTRSVKAENQQKQVERTSRSTKPTDKRVAIEVDASNGTDTDHLLPVIELLKKQGNKPATNDEFRFNRDGFGVYGFQQPIDIDLLKRHFYFPPTIILSGGALRDDRHFVGIEQYSDSTKSPVINFNL